MDVDEFLNMIDGVCMYDRCYMLGRVYIMRAVEKF